MVNSLTIDLDTVRSLVASVVDPEIPVLTVEDLGILRSVEAEDGVIVVTITPTYSGCPAMRQIEDDIVTVLDRNGVQDVEVRVTHNPTWSTEWITADGRRKLSEFGIAPPVAEDAIVCPRCAGSNPKMIARFGSTACKALMVCSQCGEPFDYFKQF